jgi:hypothetical protein
MSLLVVLLLGVAVICAGLLLGAIASFGRHDMILGHQPRRRRPRRRRRHR